MNRNLGPQWYQPAIPGMPEPRGSLPVVPPETAHPTYNDVSGTRRDSSDGWVPNILPHTPQGAFRGLSRARKGPEVEEMVPTSLIHSTQPNIHEPSVQHQVLNADPLRLDEDVRLAAAPYDGAEIFSVRDGNHRVAAALRRGQLLVPARVARER